MTEYTKRKPTRLKDYDYSNNGYYLPTGRQVLLPYVQITEKIYLVKL
ncbi:MAG: hypothetical protein ABH836_00680 [Candidatus Omnitrophota bacterium]